MLHHVKEPRWPVKRDGVCRRAPQERPRPRGRFLTLDNRFLPPLLITSILLAAHLSFGILEGVGAQRRWRSSTAIGAELVMGRITYGKWPHPASAYISGISAGILVRSPFLWPYFLTSLISITSKYVLRVKGRHLWNPSNFGVSAVAVPGAGDGDGAEHPVGQRRRADGRHLAARLGDRLARRPRAHLGDLRRRRSWSSRSCAARSPGTPWLRDGRADHRADVSALHLLHGDRPEDDGALEDSGSAWWSSWWRSSRCCCG